MRVEHAIRGISKSGVVGQSKSTNFNLPELRPSLKIDILIGSETLYITTIAFFLITNIQCYLMIHLQCKHNENTQCKNNENAHVFEILLILKLTVYWKRT